MALVKRDKIYHYDFEYQGTRYRESTGQTDRNKAKLVEAKVRTDLALGAFGIAAPRTTPLVKAFLEGRFLEHVRQYAKRPGTAAFYAEKILRLLEYPPFITLRLSEIDADLVSRYAGDRLRAGMAVASINGELATLRKALNLALDWRLIHRPVKIRSLPGAKTRTFVLDGELENFYLEVAPYPLRQVAILMLDLGFRPQECLYLKKADITDEAVTLRIGKTVNATRTMPQTERTRAAIQLLMALWPDSEWLFPGRKGKPYGRRSLDNLHAKVRAEHGLPADFVLYSKRHTFGTRFAESCDGNAFLVKAAMGHASIATSQRYVHPSDDHLRLALKRKEAFDKMMREDRIHDDIPTNSSAGPPKFPTDGR